VRLQFGDFAADFDSRQLWRGAAAVAVGPKAFELLELLVRSRHRALSKAQIRAELWPRTFVSESNLTSVVNELRTALGDRAKGARYVRTVYVVERERATLEDLGSKNGTFVGGTRIVSPQELADGDAILLGRVPVTFRVLPPVSTETGVDG
jgi:hypothetical protein